MNKDTRHNLYYFFSELVLGLIGVVIAVFIFGIVKKRTILTIISGAATIILIIILFFLIYLYKRKKRKR